MKQTTTSFSPDTRSSHWLAALRALGAADAAGVGRDPLLRVMVLLPLGVALAARWLLPAPLARAGALLGVDLLPFYAPVISYALLLLAPSVCGMVVGFLLLDQRDDRTLLALRVTPLPPAAYLAYRLGAPTLLSLLMTAVALPLSGTAGVGPGGVLLAALAAAPLAPLGALFLAVFAANKVQGFALQKALGVLVVAPLAGALAPLPWGLLAGLAPSLWPAALLWEMQAGGGRAAALFAVGVAHHGALLALLLRRFQRGV
ncbi:MAG TPA: hypothetical protein VFS21_24655 [Roseiflexaceae bacterium]|nr:hypothetical protein [Roseiflexaceae bacterium]